MQRFAVRLAENHRGLDSQLAARAQNADGDFAAIGN
jgi:hypothetical protein